MSGALKKGLTRQKVAVAAVEVVRAEGLDAVTMRRVGAQLGCEAMSLYTWVDSKADLFVAVCDQLLAPDVAKLLTAAEADPRIPPRLVTAARRFLVTAATTGGDLPDSFACDLALTMFQSVALAPEPISAEGSLA